MKNLLFAILFLPLISIAQDDISFIEIIGEAERELQPNYITAEVYISSSEYWDTYNEKEISKFENSMRKAVAKLGLEQHLMYKNQFMGSCTSFEKEFMLEFDNYDDYEKLRKAANDSDFDDLYVDWYLDEYKITDEQKNDAKDDLFVEALQDAKAKAELAGSTLNFTVGDVISIEEVDDYYDDYYDYDYYDYDYYDYDEPSKVKLSKSFYVRFEIE